MNSVREQARLTVLTGEYNHVMEYYICTNNLIGIKGELSRGYNPNISFFRNCSCCHYETPDDLTRCFWEDNIEAFKLLLPRTSPEKILGLYENGYHESGVRIWGEHAEPYLRIMSEAMNIPSSYLLEYIGFSPEFNVYTLDVLLNAIGKTEDSLDFKEMRLNSFNKEYFEHLLKIGKMDRDWMMSYIVDEQMHVRGDFDRRNALIRLGHLCIHLGFDTSKEIVLNEGYHQFGYEFSLPEIVDGPGIVDGLKVKYKISLDRLMIYIKQYLRDDTRIIDTDHHRMVRDKAEYIRQICEGPA